ncbi:hypothetical protein EZS27_012618 [termite gut metagenome]|jgi:hypothetical protein|uniref:Uncharacterized protein n=1 Tax=termite gut metagenome TaxID=433724 RepID=A0A5J4S181_9ZZZZ
MHLVNTCLYIILAGEKQSKKHDYEDSKEGKKQQNPIRYYC